LVLVALAGAAGCDKPAEEAPRARTGAEEAAKTYFEALARKDWPAAYKVLDPDSAAKVSAASFAERAQTYYQGIGFDPTEVHVQSCDERGDQAVAHVSLKGLSGSSAKFYKDAVGLHRSGAQWGVVLLDTFGKPATTARKK
jgi:hypothetical protein